MITDEVDKKIEVKIYPLQKEDVSQLEPILSQHVCALTTGEVAWEEIEEIKKWMRGEPDWAGRTRKYFVAKDLTGKVLGCMAYSRPDSDMKKHFKVSEENAAELLNAFVSSEVFRGGGVGRKLLARIYEEAKKEGKKWLVIGSGLRYQASWGFYDHLFDRRGGMIPDFCGPGAGAMTWKKDLTLV